MWCEVVVVPTLPNVYTGGAPSGATTPSAVTPGAGFATYPSVPSVTGVPINKDLNVALPTALAAIQQQQAAAAAAQKMDTTNHYHIFVGDLAPEIEPQYLQKVFSSFGVVTECKVIKDMHTQKPKGYGFVAYATKDEAEEAIQKMNGQLLGSRTIRTNWAVRKPAHLAAKDQKPLNYDEVSAAASASNCTVYVGGISRGLCEELLREEFKAFGPIHEIRIFKEKGYAFIRFDSHDQATRAIITMHGREVGGQPCKCSWGKESNEGKDDNQTLVSPAYGYFASPLGFPYNQLNYLQPQVNYPTNFGGATTGLQGSTNMLSAYSFAQQAAAAVAASQSFNGTSSTAYPLASALAAAAEANHQTLSSSTGLQYA